MLDISKKVSVHLVTYNGEKYFPFSINSLYQQTFKDFSVLIIDNHSSDKTVGAIKEYLQNTKHKAYKEITRLIQNPRNMGFAGGHNQAIQWSKSEYILMMNQDMILDKNFLKAAVNFMEDHKDAGAVTGVLFKWNFKENTESGEKNPEEKSEVPDSFGLNIYRNHRVTELHEADLKNSGEIFGVSGALPLYRREALEKTKLPLFNKTFKLYDEETQPKLYEYFDSDFHSYKEDVDLAYRLRLFGYNAYLVPSARGWHDRSATQNDTIIKNRKNKSNYVNYHSYKNHIYFLYKNVPAKIWYKNFYKILWHEMQKFFYILFFEHKTIPAFKELILNFPKMMKKRIYIQKRTGKEGWKNIEKWTIKNAKFKMQNSKFQFKIKN